MFSVFFSPSFRCFIHFMPFFIRKKLLTNISVQCASLCIYHTKIQRNSSLNLCTVKKMERTHRNNKQEKEKPKEKPRHLNENWNLSKTSTSYTVHVYPLHVCFMKLLAKNKEIVNDVEIRKERRTDMKPIWRKEQAEVTKNKWT